VLLAQYSHALWPRLPAGSIPCGLAGEPVLAGFHEFFGPGIVGAGLDAFPAAQVIDRYLAPETLQHDADLLFRGVLTPGGDPDLSDEATGFVSPGSAASPLDSSLLAWDTIKLLSD